MVDFKTKNIRKGKRMDIPSDGYNEAMKEKQEIVKDVIDEIMIKQIERGSVLLIWDELEKVRRYLTFRLQRLYQIGLFVKITTRQWYEDNKICFYIELEFPEGLIPKKVEDILRTTEKYRERKGENKLEIKFQVEEGEGDQGTRA